MIDFEALIRVLTDAKVEFVVIGGVAATLHGSARLTMDLDIAYARSPENLERIAAALAPLSPYLRGAPAGLPFTFDARTLAAGANFTLTTTAGPIDLLADVAGVDSFEELARSASVVEIFGRHVRVASLEMLVRMKRAAGRPKDLEVISELELLHSYRQSEE